MAAVRRLCARMGQLYGRVRHRNDRFNQWMRESRFRYTFVMVIATLFGTFLGAVFAFSGVNAAMTALVGDASFLIVVLPSAAVAYVGYTWRETDWSFPTSWPDQEK